MTREEATALLKSRVDLIKSNYPEIDDYRESLEMAIEALEQEPCEDAISRQAVLEWCGDINMDVYTNEVKEFVLNLPPVTPQPKTGRWIDEGLYAEGHNEHAYRCSECGEHYIGYVGEFKYCPNCGAKMAESEK